MEIRRLSWWQKIKHHWTAVTASVLVVVILMIVVGYWFDWTGFKSKTLWDWLNLLGVFAIPAVVGLGTVWFTTQQGKVSDRENKDNQRETALQAYIDKMSELLLDKNLRESAEDAEVRKITRVRTLTVLPRLDAVRKKSVLQFLYEAGLIEKDKYIVDLKGADLSGAFLYIANLSGANLTNVDLSGAYLDIANLQGATLSSANLSAAKLWSVDLRGADLREAYLSDANLRDAHLNGADLSGAHLRDAHLNGAHLSGANLTNANLSGAFLFKTNFRGANLNGADLSNVNLYFTEQLEQAYSLQGTTMPNGAKHL
jgi:uncharacterized protein YjbI with pentapeptide repeats